MTRISRPIHRDMRWRYKIIFVVIGFGIISGFFLMLLQNFNARTERAKKETQLQSGVVTYSVYGDIQEVPYYHCASSYSADNSHHLVLLHGARFTKEDWKSSGIMDTLCSYPYLSVSTLDLSVKAGHRDIAGVLSAMTDKLQIRLPVTLVTPSASGMGIVDWMSTGRLPDLPKYVQKWIPVACFAVSAATEDQLARLSRLESFDVLAIYGSKDRGGKEISTRLEDFVGARSLELQGGHACYLESPNEFCNAVVGFLG